MNYKGIKVVFIDWYGTLSVTKFWHQLEDPKHPHHHYWSVIEGEMSDQKPQFLDSWMRGSISSEEVVRRIAKATNLSYSTLFDEFVKSAETHTVIPGALPLIHQIRSKGIHVGIATDNMDSFYRWTIPSLNLKLKFDYILNSAVSRVLKRDCSKDGDNIFFSRFMREHDVLPHECLLIDDSVALGPVIRSFDMQFVPVKFGDGLIPVLDELLVE
ncbi:HAD family hydrolase [Candidatus Woesebacteria bacterium]|jgi:beta-phosphoglucomutase-like phosphatase (HAD superfamily)|nr:HAD family hydrolase [Candidatus Woesebacteria bacterium]MBP9687148.1 HAD family hydrolase [Candidatus Woesebacteria bacterium]